MVRTKVVVTGVGFCCPQGTGTLDVFERFVAGKNAIADSRFGHPVGLVPDLDAAEVMGSRKEARRSDRVAHLAVAAAQQAVAHAGLDPQACDPDRSGVVFGTGIGGIQTLIEQHDVLLEKGPDRVSPFLVPAFMPNGPAANIAMRLGFCGPNTTVTTACAAGGHAVGDASLAIRSGAADIMLAGGVEACITELTVAAFQNIGALTRTGSRPFDAGRDGFVMAEGSAVLVLESEEHARERGADVICELAGYGRTADAYHITAPHPEGRGAVRAIEMALRDAELDPSDIGYVNAHGTSTPLNDLAEARALRAVFGDEVPPASSVKSMVGHLVGAAGALEAGITALALREGLLPPTINQVDPDPEIGLDIVPNEAREVRGLRAAISNSFGFGGQNAVLAFRLGQ